MSNSSISGDGSHQSNPCSEMVVNFSDNEGSVFSSATTKEQNEQSNDGQNTSNFVSQDLKDTTEHNLSIKPTNDLPLTAQHQSLAGYVSSANSKVDLTVQNEQANDNKNTTNYVLQDLKDINKDSLSMDSTNDMTSTTKHQPETEQIHSMSCNDESILDAKHQPVGDSRDISLLGLEANVEINHSVTTGIAATTTPEKFPNSGADEDVLNMNYQNNSVTSSSMNDLTIQELPLGSKGTQGFSNRSEISNHHENDASNCLSGYSVNTSENTPDIAEDRVTQETTKHDQSTVCVTNIIVEDINIKQEPLDEDYAKVELLHRGQPIVVYSDDDNDADDSGSSSSSYIPPIEERLNEVEEVSSDEETGKKNSTKRNMYKNKSRTEGEIFPEELPPMEYLMISPDESVELEPLGVVSGIVDVLVVVKADNNSPALYDDTILFVEERKPLGLIFETFGTVEKPYYSVRFNSASDIAEKGIEVGQRVYFAPKADNLTKYVFIAELRKVKCDDASWKNDNEVPAAYRDYSDDEEERKEKRRAKNKERGIADSDQNEESPLRRKKKKWPGQDALSDSDPNRPSLLPGELMRNPFGAKGQRFKAVPSNQWPPPGSTNNNGQRGPRVRSPFSTPPPRPDPHMFNTHMRPRPPAANFGQNPRWAPRPTAPPFSGPPPFQAQNCPPAAGQTQFPAMTPPSFVPFGQSPSGSHVPTFSAPCPPPFHGNKTFRTHTPATYSSTTPSGPPSSLPVQGSPSFPPCFPPPPPSNFFAVRPANFNPSVPPPPPLSQASSQGITSFSLGQPSPSNNPQRFQSQFH